MTSFASIKPVFNFSILQKQIWLNNKFCSVFLYLGIINQLQNKQ